MFDPLYVNLVRASHARAAARVRSTPRDTVDPFAPFAAAIRRAERRSFVRIFDPPAAPDPDRALARADGAALPLDTRCTRITLTTTRRRVTFTRTLCVACACVATRSTVRTFALRSVAVRTSRVRHSARVFTSGVACDACGVTSNPYAAPPAPVRSLHSLRMRPPRRLPH